MTDLSELLKVQNQILEEQRKTNHLLLLLIDALGDGDDQDNASEPVTYLSGKPRG